MPDFGSTTSVQFGSFRLDRAAQRLWRGDQEITLRRKSFELLKYVIEHAGELITKEALLTAVWPNVLVGEGSLAVDICSLRRALEDDSKDPRYIATVHGLGYRFIAPITPAQSEAASPQMPVEGHRLIGRAAELSLLQGYWTQATGGARQMVFIAGEAGIGKTTLVEAFMRDIRRAPSAWVGSGQCVELHGAGEPYLPILEALEGLWQNAASPYGREVLRRVAPNWIWQLPSATYDRTDTPHQPSNLRVNRTRMLAEFADAIDALAHEQPLLVIFEDLHWSDYSTLDALTVLARRREPARLLVLATYRPVDANVSDHSLLGRARPRRAGPLIVMGRAHERPRA